MELTDVIRALSDGDAPSLDAIDMLRREIQHIVRLPRVNAEILQRVHAAAREIDEMCVEDVARANSARQRCIQLLRALSQVDERVVRIEIPPAQDPPEEAVPASERTRDPSDVELIREFVIESQEYLVSAEGALLRLEEDPTDTAAVDAVFRVFHTVKGVSSLLGFSVISEFAHRAETLLSRVRGGERMFDTRSANLALRSVDIVKGMIEHVAVSLQDTDLVLPLDFDDLSRDLAAPVSRPRPSSPNGSGAAAVSRRSNAPASRRSFRPHSHHPPATDVAWRTRRPGGPSSLANPTSGAVSLDAATRRAHSTDASVRVRTDLLDRLMDMVGELVVAQAAVSEDPSLAGASMPRLRTKVSHSEKIVRELQRLSLALRMVPIKGTFQKMVRVVRDIAQRTGKSAMLLTTGDETEVDRTIVDAIADPLLHMVRNAVDHGIEAPHDRIALGKPSCGTVTLRAYAAGDSVVVELRDDGRGLNRQKLVARAVERGLIRDDAQMSDSDVYGLIFAPGFSTADTVTDVSGRGVGMDVVKQAIEGLNGRVEILSVEGQGTVFRVHLPLTLAVTDGVLVRVGKERFIIPTHGIETSFRPEASQLCTLPEGEALRVREAQIPMFRLSQLFGVRSATLNPCEGLALILSDREGRVALLVDALLGKQQAITRGLGAGIGKVPGILGGAILGDGRVSLIIDTSGLIALARSEKSPSRTAA